MRLVGNLATVGILLLALNSQLYTDCHNALLFKPILHPDSSIKQQTLMPMEVNALFKERLISCSSSGPETLFTGVKTVSQILNSESDVEWIDTEVDKLAGQVNATEKTLEDLLQVLRQEGHGNVKMNVVNPYELSDIEVVLRTGEGLPIAIAMIVLEVSRRANIPAHGINSPGIFLMNIQDTVINPDKLEKIDYDQFTKATAGRQLGAPDKEESADNLTVLQRILQNLTESALTVHNHIDAMVFCDYIKAMNPSSWQVHFDRARVWLDMGDADGAIQDLNDAISHTTSPLNRQILERQIEAIRKEFKSTDFLN